MNRKYRVYQVDSFTKEVFKGNPAGVVPEADGLSDEEMQNIAKELNNSETAFIINPTENNYDVWVRFFTPKNEVPSCGHATIAAHYVRAIEKNLNSCTVIQKIGAGILPVDIKKTNDEYLIRMTQGKIEFSPELNEEICCKIETALGITKNNLIVNCPIQIVSTGHSKVIIGINDEKLIDTLKPNMDLLSKISDEIGCNGFFVFSFNSNKTESLTKGRMFAPAIGINEDPVTGNANGPLGAYLVKHKLVSHNGKELKFIGIQGEAIGRPGKIEVEVIIENDNPVKIKISGEACIVFKTEIEI